MIVVCTGPSELHAHIDLDHRARDLAPSGAHRSLTVLATSEHESSWPVAAELCTSPGTPRSGLIRSQH